MSEVAAFDAAEVNSSAVSKLWIGESSPPNESWVVTTPIGALALMEQYDFVALSLDLGSPNVNGAEILDLCIHAPAWPKVGLCLYGADAAWLAAMEAFAVQDMTQVTNVFVSGDGGESWRASEMATTDRLDLADFPRSNDAPSRGEPSGLPMIWCGYQDAVGACIQPVGGGTSLGPRFVELGDCPFGTKTPEMRECSVSLPSRRWPVHKYKPLMWFDNNS